MHSSTQEICLSIRLFSFQAVCGLQVMFLGAGIDAVGKVYVSYPFRFQMSVNGNIKYILERLSV